MNKHAQPLRLLFTDQTKVITSAGGQNSVTQMIGSLYDAIEIQYGMFASRLFRAFRPAPVDSGSPVRWRRLCGVPYVFIYMVCLACVLASVVLTAVSIGHKTRLVGKSAVPPGNGTASVDYDDDVVFEDDGGQEDIIVAFLVTMAAIVAVVLVANIYTIASCIQVPTSTIHQC